MAAIASCTVRLASVAALVLAATTSAAHVDHIVPYGQHGGYMPERYSLYHRESFLHHRGVKHCLRICNAYPNGLPLDVFHGHRIKLTQDEPMQYKSCKDFFVGLKAGEKIQFKLGEHNAGIFIMQAIPDDESVLLLVIQRHDTVSTAVSFKSHMFAKHDEAQVAIIDTFEGGEVATASMAKLLPREELEPRWFEFLRTPRPVVPRGEDLKQSLRYNSLVTIGQGTYNVNISSSDGETIQKSRFVALNHESYVILRTGVDVENGDAFPQELVVYPQSDASQLPKPNGAPGRSGFVGVAAALLASFAIAVM